MNGLNRFLVGCECTRPTLDSIGAAGFDVVRVDHMELPKTPRFVRPSIVGVATAPLPAPQRDPELASS
jgi:hypothetical protein